MHIYHVASGTPVVTILRPARTPKGTEVRTNASHSEWPHTDPAGRIASARPLNRHTKTRHVVHDSG
jgi:hypothetical protein